SPKVANVTNTVGVFPGFISGSFAYRRELSRQPQNILAIIAPSALGALSGSAILLLTPADTFRAMVPFLILAACLVFGLQERIARLIRRHQDPDGLEQRHLWGLRAAVFLGAVYGGFFGAGLGIILLAALSLMLPDDIQRTNALRGIIALIVNGLAAGYFAL